MKYRVTVTEQVTKIFEVEAESMEDAQEKVELDIVDPPVKVNKSFIETTVEGI